MILRSQATQMSAPQLRRSRAMWCARAKLISRCFLMALVAPLAATTCSPGEHKAEGGDGVTCVRCPTGRFQGNRGMNECALCDAGHFASSVGSAACRRCPAGKYAMKSGADSCAPCARGRFGVHPGAVHCAACATGQNTRGKKGQKFCKPCDMGRYGVLEAAGAHNAPMLEWRCVACAAGRFGEIRGSVGAASCRLCPAGQSSPRYSTHCTHCEQGTFALAAGSSKCATCPQGQHTASYASSSCVTCEIGRYADINGMAHCKTCGSGRFAGVGAHACTTCAAGKSTRGTIAQAACVPCAAGLYSVLVATDSFSAGSRAPDMISVSDGDGTEARQCRACPAGRFQPLEGQESPDSCKPCALGHFSVGDGKARCSACAAGQYVARHGQSHCEKCKSGRAQHRSGWVNCYKCKPGYFAADTGTLNCHVCPSGTFNQATAAVACSRCPHGKYGAPASEGRRACVGCAPGKFRTSGKSSAESGCTKCPSGHYSADAMAQHCHVCGAGRTQPLPGQRSCNACGPGRMARSPVELCSECVRGRFSDGHTGWCKCCPAGRFSARVGAKSCTTCVAGRYSDHCASSCRTCVAGRYRVASAGSKGCSPCAAGRFTPKNGTATPCAACPIGRVSPQGALGCTLCSKGMAWTPPRVTNDAGPSCKPCARGRFQPHAGATRCALCPRGKHIISRTSCACDFAGKRPGTCFYFPTAPPQQKALNRTALTREHRQKVHAAKQLSHAPTSTPTPVTKTRPAPTKVPTLAPTPKSLTPYQETQTTVGSPTRAPPRTQQQAWPPPGWRLAASQQLEEPSKPVIEHAVKPKHEPVTQPPKPISTNAQHRRSRSGALEHHPVKLPPHEPSHRSSKAPAKETNGSSGIRSSSICARVECTSGGIAAVAAGAAVFLALGMGFFMLRKGLSKEDAGVHPISPQDGLGGELRTLLEESKQPRLSSVSQTRNIRARQDLKMDATNDPSAIVAALYPSAVAEAQRAGCNGNKHSRDEEYWSAEDDDEDGGAILNSEVRGIITNKINEAAAAPI